MTTHQLTRRRFGMQLLISSAGAALGSAAVPRVLAGATARRARLELVRDAEMIHEVLTLAAPPARVFDVLTNAQHFSAMTKFSTVPNGPPARIADDAGGEFSLFGGHIVGRQIDLVPAKRVVQAWRVADWEQGVYSIVRFELAADGPGTRLSFDHSGFPKGQGEHLVQGWSANYWNPMRKYLR